MKTAWVMGSDLRPYRIPFIRRVVDSGALNLELFPSERVDGRERASSPSELDDTTPVHLMKPLRWPRGGLRVAWLRGTRRVLRGGFDVIICPENVHNLSVWAIAAFHRRYGARLVLHGHGKRIRFSQGRVVRSVRNLARRALLSRADAIVAYSEKGCSEIIEMGVAADKVFVAQNTLDISALRAAEKTIRPLDLETLRSELQLSPSKVILFLGRLQTIKRVDILIDAVRQERARGLDCSLIVVGEGPEKSALEALAADVDRVHFLGELYDLQMLAQLFLVSDVLAIPGRVVRLSRCSLASISWFCLINLSAA